MRSVWSVALGLIMSSGLAHAQEASCPAITELASGMSAAIAEAELEQAGALAAQANTAALCQSQPHQTMLLAQLFRMSGATAYFSGDMAAATEAFTLAASISPGEDLEAAFGQQAGAFYGGIRDARVKEAGASIKLTGSGAAWIDGRPLRSGVARDLTAGPHILQTQESGGPLKAEVLTLSGGEDKVLSIGSPQVAAPVPEEPVTTAHTPKPAARNSGIPTRTLMLGGGGALIAAGAGMLFIASSTHAQFDEETDPSKLDDLQSKTNSMGTMGLVAGIAGLGMVGVSTQMSGGGLGLQIHGRW